MKRIENERLEWKETVTSDLKKEIAAFANSCGGEIFVGIRDNGEAVGVENCDAVMQQISNMIRDGIRPDLTMFVKYGVEVLDGKDVVKVTVLQGSDRPYFLTGKGLRPEGVYVRQGSSSVPASQDRIRQMIKDTDGDTYENRRSLEQNLTFVAAEKIFQRKGMELGRAQMKTLHLLSGDGIYTNAAFLLSDQCTCTMKLAAFQGDDKDTFHDRRELEGSLFQQMEEAYDYLSMRNQMRSVFEGLYRKDMQDYPEEAVREALLNALIHRDYGMSAPTLISVFADRIEFLSPGGLTCGLSPEDIMLGISACRNPAVANVFYRLELIEAYGTGLQRIIRSYSDSRKKPEMYITEKVFKLILPNRNCCSDAADMAEKSGSSRVSDNVLEYRCESTVLDFASQKGYILRSDVEKILGASQATSNRLLRKMEQEGSLVREGKGKNTRYVLR